MKASILTLLFGRDELVKLFVTLLKQRKTVHKLRLESKALDREADNLRYKQTQNTTDQKAAVLSYNDTRAALARSFDL